MKKGVSLLLTLILCFTLAACGGTGSTGNPDYDYIISLLDRGEYDMAIQVIDMLRNKGSEPAGTTGSDPLDDGSISRPGTNSFPARAVIVNGTDYRFQIRLVNKTGRQLTLKELRINDYSNGGGGPNVVVFDGAEYQNQDWYALSPGMETIYEDWHPYPAPFAERDYTFVYLDDEGTEYTVSYVFDMQEAVDDGNASQSTGPSTRPAVDYSQDQTQDLVTLRSGADFEVEVRPGVYWVPANALGSSRYTNAEIYQMLQLSPEEKQSAVSTLYEALQLYQVGGFCSADDNIHMREDGVDWEHHKPGYYAVTTNCGCCATDSDWLHYILNGNYDEIGYIGTSQRDGNGHVFNYILQDGWYYLVDLTHYRAGEDWLPTAVEDGSMDSYYNSDFILGNIHKTRSLEAYAEYILEMFGDPPGLIVRYTADDVPAVASVFGENNQIEIVYAEMNGIEIQVLFDDSDDNLTFRLAPAPIQLPDWQ